MARISGSPSLRPRFDLSVTTAAFSTRENYQIPKVIRDNSVDAEKNETALTFRVTFKENGGDNGESSVTGNRNAVDNLHRGLLWISVVSSATRVDCYAKFSLF